MTAARMLLCCGACVFVGCLFPSFDELKNDPKKSSKSDGGTSGDSSSSTSTSSSSSSSSGTSASSSSSSASSGDGGNGKDIACKEPCAPPGNFCCTTVGGPKCQGPGTEGFCTTVEGGEIFRCDGAEDCDVGQVCCFANQEATCAATCGAGQVLCNGPNPACPGGKSCTALVENTFKACK